MAKERERERGSKKTSWIFVSLLVLRKEFEYVDMKVAI
jgi:hypothetical protein